ALLLIFPASQAFASEAPTPETGLGENFLRSFTGYRLALQLGAVASTAALSQWGTDASVHRYFRSGQSDAWADPSEYLGFLLPPVVAGGLYVAAKTRDDDKALSASFAAIQSTLMTLGYVSVLKFVSGRPPPDDYDVSQRSHEFDFGLGNGGIIYGWPSGHTAVTAALLSSLASYYESPMLWCFAAAGTA